jgi:hypothetical protein
MGKHTKLPHRHHASTVEAAARARRTRMRIAGAAALICGIALAALGFGSTLQVLLVSLGGAAAIIGLALLLAAARA